jgi:hypothetical protein
MNQPELISCYLKLGRAREHFDCLGNELLTWANAESMRIIKETAEEGRVHRVFVEPIADPPVDRWALIAGDCVHNLCSALDSLLYEIAIIQTGQNPPLDEKVLQFLIVTDPAGFQNQTRRIKTLSPAVRDAIEAVQPYNQPHPELPPLLELLSFFNNQDKHRTLNVVVASPHSASVTMTDMTPSTITPIRTAIRGKTEILSFTMDSPAPSLDYKCSVVIPICIQHEPGPSKSPFNELAGVLEMLIAEVEIIIQQVTAAM